jgi:hypothetical protein
VERFPVERESQTRNKEDTMTYEDYEDIEICLWPDDSWCYPDELEEFLSFKSDYYVVVSANEFIKRTGDTL